MQLRLPWLVPSGSRAAASRQVVAAGRTFPVDIARHRWARRYVLRVTPDGRLRLTVPRNATIGGGVRFAERQADWIAREWQRQEDRSAAWVTGTELWFRGERVQLVLDGDRVVCAGETIAIEESESVRHAVESHLRELATRELPPRCASYAEQFGLSVAKVSVRDQRSRWGACSPRSAITLNWRLIQMPGDVADYVILHELMHLRQPNHSRKFWREVNGVCAWWRDAERWLRRHGREVL